MNKNNGKLDGLTPVDLMGKTISDFLQDEMVKKSREIINSYQDEDYNYLGNPKKIESKDYFLIDGILYSSSNKI
jgi:light-regulated signal transduction histidine kinase (bacteriophytochrome)